MAKTLKELLGILGRARGVNTPSHATQVRAREEFVGQGANILGRLAAFEEPTVGEARIICPGCGNSIDPDICGCGDGRHPYDDEYGHPFVPMGCDCRRVKEEPASALSEEALKAGLQKANHDYWAVTHPTLSAASNPYKEGIVIVDDPKDEDASAHDARARIATFLDGQRIARGEPIPCPFCGRTPVVEPWHGGGPDKHVVHCDFENRCKANPAVDGATKSEAIRNWNTRPEEPR